MPAAAQSGPAGTSGRGAGPRCAPSRSRRGSALGGRGGVRAGRPPAWVSAERRAGAGALEAGGALTLLAFFLLASVLPSLPRNDFVLLHPVGAAGRASAAARSGGTYGDPGGRAGAARLGVALVASAAAAAPLAPGGRGGRGPGRRPRPPPRPWPRGVRRPSSAWVTTSSLREPFMVPTPRHAYSSAAAGPSRGRQLDRPRARPLSPLFEPWTLVTLPALGQVGVSV